MITSLYSKAAATAAIAAAGLMVGACGGGGGSDRPQLAPAPPTSPTPPPSNAATGVIHSAVSTQTFATEGENLHYDGNLQVRYDAANGQYFVTVPGQSEALLENDPNAVVDPGSPGHNYRAGDMHVTTLASGTADDPDRDYDYSSLAYFHDGNFKNIGVTAFGMATPASALPTVGSASYSGFIRGYSSEMMDLGDWGIWAAAVSGSINLSFDFGAGNLSGTMNPILHHLQDHNLGTLTISQPVWGVGSPNFSGMLTGSSLTGDPAGITGTFTGPAAQELIGSFFFGYVSPVSGMSESAGGAFLGKR